MALINRMSRLFRADVHAVLDRIEEPATLLRQAIREMEDALAQDEQRARLLGHEAQQLAVRLAEVGRSLDEIGEQLDICFRSGREDLARALIRRQLEAQQLQRLLAGRRDGLTESLAELERRLSGNRERLAQMRQKAELVAEEEGGVADDRWATATVAVRDEDVEVAFLREKQRRARS